MSKKIFRKREKYFIWHLCVQLLGLHVTFFFLSCKRVLWSNTSFRYDTVER